MFNQGLKNETNPGTIFSTWLLFCVAKCYEQCYGRNATNHIQYMSFGVIYMNESIGHYSWCLNF